MSVYCCRLGIYNSLAAIHECYKCTVESTPKSPSPNPPPPPLPSLPHPHLTFVFFVAFKVVSVVLQHCKRRFLNNDT